MDIVVDRQGLQVLDEEEALRLLASRPVGRIAVIQADRPTIVPVNYGVDGRDVVSHGVWDQAECRAAAPGVPGRVRGRRLRR